MPLETLWQGDLHRPGLHTKTVRVTRDDSRVVAEFLHQGDWIEAEGDLRIAAYEAALSASPGWARPRST